MLERRGMAGDADGLDPEQFQPTDVGQGITDSCHLPVEDRVDLAAGEGEVARFGVAMHQSDSGARLGLAVAQRLLEPFQGG